MTKDQKRVVELRLDMMRAVMVGADELDDVDDVENMLCELEASIARIRDVIE